MLWHAIIECKSERMTESSHDNVGQLKLSEIAGSSVNW